MSFLSLSGWTQAHDALAPILPTDCHMLNYHPGRTPAHVMEQLAPYAAHTEAVIGWSLGGWLAMQATLSGVLSPNKLVLLAPPLQFVRSEDFHTAMDPLIFEQFYKNYRDDPARTAKKFSQLLVQGDKFAASLQKTISLPPHKDDAANWHPWLDTLAEMHHADMPLHRLPETLIIHGENDSIIPHAQSVYLAQQHPNAELVSLPGCGHTPHWHAPALLRRKIADFLEIEYS